MRKQFQFIQHLIQITINHQYLNRMSKNLHQCRVICCSCCQPDYKAQKCPAHNNQDVTFMCNHSKCHQVLCNSCLSSHQNLHRKNMMSEMSLSHLNEISKIYTKQNINHELKQIKSRTQKPHQKPQQLISSYIEEALYGTTQIRQKQLQTNLRYIQQNYSTNILMKFVEDDNGYSVKDNNYSLFKEKYWRFLDDLMTDIENGKYK